jgi:hypothetical protein
MSLSILFPLGVMIVASVLLMSFFYNWLDARASSWDRLAIFYATEAEPDSNAVVRTTFAMNNRCYRGIATIGASRRGLYLALKPSCRFLHPSLFIPWSDMQAMLPQTDARCVFRLKATGAKLRLDETAIPLIQQFIPGNGPRRSPLAA